MSETSDIELGDLFEVFAGPGGGWRLRRVSNVPEEAGSVLIKIDSDDIEVLEE